MTARRATSRDELSIREWAAELEAAAKIARDLAGTAFMPETHKRFRRDASGALLDGKDGRAYALDPDATTATAAAAIMRGWELGMPPGAALASIQVINNTPALSALALRAILQTHGHDIWVLPESNSTRAIVRARRAGSDEVQQSIWTIDRARALVGQAALNNERSNWKRQPTAMLIARATAEAARWVAADAILGIPAIAEELLDELDGAPLAIEAAPPAVADGTVPAIAAPVPAPRPSSARRRRSTASVPALPTGPPPPAADVPPDPPPAPGKIAKTALDRLHAGLREVGVGDDRERALTLVSGWAGRRVESTKELTAAEAHTVLDALDSLRSLMSHSAVEDEQAAAEESQAPPADQDPPP